MRKTCPKDGGVFKCLARSIANIPMHRRNGAGNGPSHRKPDGRTQRPVKKGDIIPTRRFFSGPSRKQSAKRVLSSTLVATHSVTPLLRTCLRPVMIFAPYRNFLDTKTLAQRGLHPCLEQRRSRCPESCRQVVGRFIQSV